MAQWALLTMRTYKITLEYLWYLQYPGDPATALQAKKRSSRTRKDVFQCFVFGGEGILRRPCTEDFLSPLGWGCFRIGSVGKRVLAAYPYGRFPQDRENLPSSVG
mmetsp:Transcript_29222/g.93453  ORF Transcript_29222/g.93453 Transcript_29222/m.93453 type:complete len:105 (-) Transcript_29222:616-930(-)